MTKLARRGGIDHHPFPAVRGTLPFLWNSAKSCREAVNQKQPFLFLLDVCMVCTRTKQVLHEPVVSKDIDFLMCRFGDRTQRALARGRIVVRKQAAYHAWTSFISASISLGGSHDVCPNPPPTPRVTRAWWAGIGEVQALLVHHLSNHHVCRARRSGSQIVGVAAARMPTERYRIWGGRQAFEARCDGLLSVYCRDCRLGVA